MSSRGRGDSNAPAWMSRQGGDMRGPPPPMDDRDSSYGRTRDSRGPPHYRDRDYPPRGGFRGRGGGGPPRPRRTPPRGIVFRSYEEECDWVEDRRRKREARKSLWDVPPTPEQAALDAQQAETANFCATDFSGGTDTGLPQQTRHARRLYLGNLPNVQEEEVHDFFRNAIQQAMPSKLEEDPILSVYINHERRFCFLEFKSVEMTTACLQLDGIDINGKGKVHVKRPNDYNPMLAPPVHPSKIPPLDVSRLGIISRTVPDGPNKVFVGGLHYHLTENQVLELLQAFGAVKAFHLVAGEDPTLSKGYCFVEYADPAVTQVAIVGLNGMDLGGGKVLTARIAAAREDTSVLPAASSGNWIGGYDVEALVDAAMGLRPMPIAPTVGGDMMPNMGGGMMLTMGSGMMPNMEGGMMPTMVRYDAEYGRRHDAPGSSRIGLGHCQQGTGSRLSWPGAQYQSERNSRSRATQFGD